MLTLVGCSSAPVLNDGYAIAGKNKKVSIQARHTSPFQKYTGVWVDVWHIRIVNNDRSKDWCVGVEWRALDYTINVANNWFYVPAESRVDIGSVVQRTWDFGGGPMTFDTAGFAVYKVLLRKPNNGQCYE